MSSSWVGPLLVLLALTVIPTVAAEDPAEPPPCEADCPEGGGSGEGEGCGEDPCPADNATEEPQECTDCEEPEECPDCPPPEDPGPLDILRKVPATANLTLGGVDVQGGSLKLKLAADAPLDPELKSCSWVSLDTSNPRVATNPVLGVLLVNPRCANLIVKGP